VSSTDFFSPNSMAEFQSMFYSANAPQASADGAALSRSAEKLRTDAGFFLRLFVDELLVSFQDDRLASSASSNELQVNATSLVFSSTISRNSPPSISFSLAEVSLIERLLKDGEPAHVENPLVYFRNHLPSEDSSVIPKHPFDFQRTTNSLSLTGPQLEISVAMRPVKEGGMNISVQFQHAVCQVTLASINRWTATLSEFLAPQTTPSSSVAFSCSVVLQSIEVTLRESPDSDRRTPFPPLTVSSLSKSRWKKLSSVAPSASSRPGGSFRVVLKGVSLAISSNEKSNSAPAMGPFSVSLEEINGFLQLQLPSLQEVDRIETWELGFLSLRSERDGSKISLSKEKYLGPEGLSVKPEVEDSERLTAGEAFEMPTLILPDILVISAGNVYAGHTPSSHPSSLNSDQISRTSNSSPWLPRWDYIQRHPPPLRRLLF
jgi:hypothetical protein